MSKTNSRVLLQKIYAKYWNGPTWPRHAVQSELLPGQTHLHNAISPLSELVVGSTEKVLVVTASFGKGRLPPEPLAAIDGWEYVCFTDRAFDSEIWDVQVTGLLDPNPLISNRKVKFSIGRLEGIWDLIIYVDSNFLLSGEANRALLSHCPRGCVSLFRHSQPRTPWEDMVECLRLKKVPPDKVLSFLELCAHYDDMTKKVDYIEAGVVITRPCAETSNFLGDWLDFFLRYPYRDQLIFPLVSRKHHGCINILGPEMGNVRDNELGFVLR